MFTTLSPTQQVARAVSDFRMGQPVRLAGMENTYVLSVEALFPDQLALIKRTAASMSLAITSRRAQVLRVPSYDGDMSRIKLDPTTIAFGTLQAVANPALDLETPMKGPFQSLRGGDPAAHRTGIALCKLAHLLPTALVVTFEGDQADQVLQQGHLWVLADQVEQFAAAPIAFGEVSAARVPLALADQGRVHVFRSSPAGEEHYAIEVGRPDRHAPVLSRLHSACFTGDVLGSLKCDCGPQLRAALSQMGTEGSGVLLYLNQEGRGIGLANKMRAYSLQDQGFDTVEANHRLGFEDDERDFRVGADILKQMGFSKTRLMTNNPAKVDRMQSCGLEVTERVPLRVGETAQNEAYLATKAAKSGHIF